MTALSIKINDLSNETSIIALQGPESVAILRNVLGEENIVSRFSCQKIVKNDLQITGWIQGTGYTGERGFEIFIPNNQAANLWESLIKFGSTPVGLGARDTLRLEKGYLLSGQDFLWPGLGIDPEIHFPEGFLNRNSVETNVPFGLDIEHDFIGKFRVISHDGGDHRWWGIMQLEKGPFPRGGKEVEDLDGNLIGKLTSGAPAPSLDRAGIGMGYIKSVSPGDEVVIVASPKKKLRAKIVRPPFI